MKKCYQYIETLNDIRISHISFNRTSIPLGFAKTLVQPRKEVCSKYTSAVELENELSTYFAYENEKHQNFETQNIGLDSSLLNNPSFINEPRFLFFSEWFAWEASPPRGRICYTRQPQAHTCISHAHLYTYMIKETSRLQVVFWSFTVANPYIKCGIWLLGYHILVFCFSRLVFVYLFCKCGWLEQLGKRWKEISRFYI